MLLGLSSPLAGSDEPNLHGKSTKIFRYSFPPNQIIDFESSCAGSGAGTKSE